MTVSTERRSKVTVHGMREGEGKELPEKNCDQLIEDLGAFIHRKFPSRELRERCKTEGSREETAEMLLSFYRGDPEFQGLLEPLVSNTGSDSCRLSALRGALVCLKAELGGSKYEAGRRKSAGIANGVAI